MGRSHPGLVAAHGCGARDLEPLVRASGSVPLAIRHHSVLTVAFGLRSVGCRLIQLSAFFTARGCSGYLHCDPRLEFRPYPFGVIFGGAVRSLQQDLLHHLRQPLVGISKVTPKRARSRVRSHQADDLHTHNPFSAYSRSTEPTSSRLSRLTRRPCTARSEVSSRHSERTLIWERITNSAIVGRSHGCGEQNKHRSTSARTAPAPAGSWGRVPPAPKVV